MPIDLNITYLSTYCKLTHEKPNNNKKSGGGLMAFWLRAFLFWPVLFSPLYLLPFILGSLVFVFFNWAFLF